MKPIRLGVIGLGPRALGLASMVQSHGSHLYEVVAVSDPYGAKIETALDGLKLPISAGYNGHEELLRHADVEAVMVETGAQVMAQICADAMLAGRHVVCDVPMFFTRDDAKLLVDTVEKTGQVYCMAEQVRFANFVDKWKQHLQQGDIGRPLFIQGEYIHPIATHYFQHMETGKYAFQHGFDRHDVSGQAREGHYEKTWRNTFRHPIKYISHELSPLLKILDDRIVQASCYGSDARMYDDDVDMLDLECALFQTAKGYTMRIVNSFTAPRGGEYFVHWYQVLGTDGLLESARPGYGDQEIIRRRDGSVEHTDYGWYRTEDNPWGDFAGGHGGLEAFVFQEFYEAIRDRRPSESDVYATVEATLPGVIAAESAEAGGIPLEVPNFRPQ